MGDSLIEIQRLTKSFGEVSALKEVDLSISDGIFGLIGPNGAGKTTLFRILLNLVQQDSGRARIFGLDVVKDSIKIRKQIGVLHERPTYPPFLSPIEYLSRMSRLYKRQRDPEELLELVGLLSARNRKIGNLSAGMYQRLGIAQSLMGFPKLVFLDEPTSNLDVIGRSEVLDLIMKLNKEDETSFVISSHILSELQTICSNLVFLANGKVLEEGSMTDIIKRHASDRIRIITSDASKLAQILKQVQWIDKIHIAGTSTIIISSTLDLEAVRTRISNIVKDSSLAVYDMSKATDLEEIFKEVIRDV